MNRFVSASELANFTYCERQWDLERRLRFGSLSTRQLAAIARRGSTSQDPAARARAAAAVAYARNVRPALHAGERYHSADARRRHTRSVPLWLTILVLVVALALVLLSLR